MVLYSNYAAKEGKKCVRIRSPDSDIFFILLYYAFDIKCKVLFDTGTGNKKRLLDITGIAEEFGTSKCSALLSLHALTGCDTTSAFRGIGKLKPMKLLEITLCWKMSWGRLG